MKKCRIIKVLIILISVFFALSTTEVFALGNIFMQGDEFIIDGKDHAEYEKDTLNTSKLETRI